jgi:hypothetical protein
MCEKVAGITRWTAEWSVKCKGEGKTDIAHGLGVRVQGGVESQWSQQPPLRGKVGKGVESLTEDIEEGGDGGVPNTL